MFNKGDIVRLKSGGPDMTVDGTNQENEIVNCKWFDGSELKQSSFNRSSLEKKEEKSI